VKTYDKTLISLHFFFMMSITAFTFFSMIVSHNYMVFEVPSTAVQHTLDPSAYAAAAGGDLTSLDYCVTPGGTQLVDYVSPGGVSYADPQCVDALDATEFTRVGAKDMWVHTHLRQRTFARDCPGADTTKWVRCTETETSSADAFIARPELLALTFDFTIETSFGMSQPPDELTVLFPSGRKITQKPRSTGEVLKLTVGDILELADVRLNETSPTAVDGGAGALRAPRIPHRLMGLKLRLIVDSTNVNENPRAAFDTRVVSVVSVKHAPTAERLGASAEVVYLGGANPPGSSLQAHDQTRVERNWGGIHLEYGSDGKVGVTSMLQTMTAITNAFVLIGMATFIVDFIGTFFPKFYDDKYEDDGEREILEDIAKHLTDPKHEGVPFDPKDLKMLNDADEPGMSYEDAIHNLIAEVNDCRERLDMLPEDEAEFEDGSDPARLPHGWPKIRLVEEFSESDIIKHAENNGGAAPVPLEIPLTAGVQMMGRGKGGVTSKAVSRQQFSLTVCKDKVRMKALKDGPGYMKEANRDGSGRFDPLKPMKSVVLSKDDRIVFRLREGKSGGHLGVFRITHDEVVEKDFWSFLMGC